MRKIGDDWQSGKILIAHIGGPVAVFGYTKGALSVHRVSRGSPKGKVPPVWSVTHIATGHGIVSIHANGSRVFELADEIATITDWSAFDSLKGWKNTDIDLPDKVVAFVERYAPEVSVKAEAHKRENEQVAQAIARAVGR